MRTVEEAQAALLAGVVPLPAVDLPLARAHGRTLAADVAARLTQPPFDASAMDGYAIRWADMPGPWTVVGEAVAGAGWPGTLGKDQAVRILTGAPLPAGADTVIVQEDVAREADQLTLAGEGPPHPATHVRRRGLDFTAGAPLLRAGERLTAARLGLAAAAGHATLPVHRPPRVALLATGDELVPPGTAPGPHQVVASAGAMLEAMLTAESAEVIDLGIVPDDRAALAAAIKRAAGCDLLLTMGGASVGDRDLVLPVLRQLGASIDFWKVALRPGKPMLAGRIGSARIIGLPGNPVSAFVCTLLFALPLVRTLAGERDPLPRAGEAPTAVALPANGPRRDFMRATLAGGAVTPAAIQDSSMLSALATANVLLIRPEYAPACPAGTTVPVLELDRSCDVS